MKKKNDLMKKLQGIKSIDNDDLSKGSENLEWFIQYMEKFDKDKYGLTPEEF